MTRGVQRGVPVAAVAALFAAGFALRPQIVAIGPLLPRIQASLGISHTVAGLLATIPVLCMGVFATAAPFVLRLARSRSLVGACLVGVGLVGIARALVPQTAGVLALTVPLGIAIAVAGTLLPVVVREWRLGRPALATGVYTTGINVGAAAASLAAVPIAAVAGWRTSLAVFSVVALALAAVWLRGAPSNETGTAERVPLPVRRPIAWLLVAVFALQSILFYGFNSWLADAYVGRGWSDGSAGALVAVMNAAALPSGLAAAWLGDRSHSRRLYLVPAATAATLAAAAIAAAAPGAWAWAVLLGGAMGVLFTVMMTLPLDVAATAADVGAVTSLMLGVGYVLSAFAPAGLGAARDLTGGFSTTLVVLAADAAVLTAVAAALSPGRLSPSSGLREPRGRSGRRGAPRARPSQPGWRGRRRSARRARG